MAKNITLEQLETLANAKNMTVDAMRKLAIVQGYKVVEPVTLDIASALSELENEDDNDNGIVIDNTMVMGDFANGLSNQALYDAMIVLTKGTLYAIAKNTDSDFAPTAFYEKDQWDRMYADPASKWHLVIMASEKFLKSVDRQADDSDNKARLIGAMVSYHNGVAIQDNTKAETEAVERKTTRKATKGTKKVNKVSGKEYVEAPSQAEKHEKRNKARNDKEAQASERYDQLSTFINETNFKGFEFVETCLRGHLNHYAKLTGVTVDPYEAAWQAAEAADDFRKLARKYARKGKVEKMAQLIVENRSNFKGLAFVHKSGINVVSKRYKVFGTVNPLYAQLGDYVEFLQEATDRANELQKAA